jgi:hypothetical protein
VTCGLSDALISALDFTVKGSQRGAVGGWVCNSLTIFVKKEAGRRSFHDSKREQICRLTVELLERFGASNDSVAQHASGAIASLAEGPEGLGKELYAAGAADIMVYILTASAFFSSTTIENCYRGLYHLSVDEQVGWVKLFKKGAIEALRLVLNRPPAGESAAAGDSGFFSMISWALRCLYAGVRYGEGTTRFYEAGGCYTLASILSRFGTTSTRIVIYCCEALISMISWEPKCLQELKQTDIHKSIVAALKEFVGRHPGVVLSTCQLLIVMTKDPTDAAIRRVLEDLHVCEIALKALIIHGVKCNDVAEATSRLLVLLLSTAYAPHKAELGTDSSFRSVRTVMTSKTKTSTTHAILKKVLLALGATEGRDF